MSNIKEVIKDLKSVRTIALDWLDRVASNLINSSQDKAGDLSLEEMSRRVNLALLALQGKDVSTKAAGESGPTSPLELFDKGPRIVRRGRGGVIDAYYLWRASRVLVRR